MSRYDTAKIFPMGCETMVHSFRLMLVSIGLLLVWAPATGAYADELFICNGNQTLRVPLDNLEHMKQTNACVAAHYGIEIKEKIAKPVVGKTLLRRLVSEPVRVHKKTAKAKVVSKKPAKKTTLVRTLPAAKKTSAKATSEVKIKRRDQPLPAEEIAADPSDHRNIRVLNATTKPTQWYRHIY